MRPELVGTEIDRLLAEARVEAAAGDMEMLPIYDETLVGAMYVAAGSTTGSEA